MAKNPLDHGTQELPFPENTGVQRSVGRPAKYASAAEKQAAYRARLKVEGKRVVQRIVPDIAPGKPIHSDVIDLSAVPVWRRR